LINLIFFFIYSNFFDIIPIFKARGLFLILFVPFFYFTANTIVLISIITFWPFLNIPFIRKPPHIFSSCCFERYYILGRLVKTSLVAYKRIICRNGSFLVFRISWHNRIPFSRGNLLTKGLNLIFIIFKESTIIKRIEIYFSIRWIFIFLINLFFL